MPRRVIHIGDVSASVSSYFVKLNDGRAYRVDDRLSTRDLRFRTTGGRTVRLSGVTTAAVRAAIDQLLTAGVMHFEAA